MVRNGIVLKKIFELEYDVIPRNIYKAYVEFYYKGTFQFYKNLKEHNIMFLPYDVLKLNKKIIRSDMGNIYNFFTNLKFINFSDYEEIDTKINIGKYNFIIPMFYNDKIKRVVMKKWFPRNKPCFCKSGKKFKKCCGKNTPYI